LSVTCFLTGCGGSDAPLHGTTDGGQSGGRDAGSSGIGGTNGTGGKSGTGGTNGSGGTSGTGGTNGTGGNTSVPGKTCTEAGGTCVGVFPGSCASGSFNASLSCGPGVGSACCISGGGGGRGGKI